MGAIFGLTFGLIVIAIVLIIAIIDAAPVFGDWFGRIHIGRFSDQRVWGTAVTETGVKWLTRTPKIKLTDNTRLIVLDMLRGNYTRPAIQHWQEASLLLGFHSYLSNNSDPKAEAAVNALISSKFNGAGQWNHPPQQVDGAILAYGVMKHSAGQREAHKAAMDQMWELIQEHIGEDGTVQYRKSMKDYRYVDTIGFICPFLVVYGLQYEKPECIQLAVRQILEFERFGMLQGTSLPCHAYSTATKYPLGLYGWGRGLGWYAIGLIDAWRELPDSHEYKKPLEEAVVRFARSALAVQGEQGQWNWTVTRPESRADSSATAMLAWFMLNASQIEEISRECLAAADSAILYLMKVTRRNGAVDFSQGDTKDIGVYSVLFNILPFTQGFCIRLANSKE
ncbi:unsaturated rhamnogalacturonyl hydrolase [Paenibacillus sophorae]|uniref:Unsaturated rhamnogalacturonyl hydrolase n=1 Tax=Paenibacillus sophorae TaxID=1333845 RepID=A0A1H8RNR1_9BACL|nr:unsaturated rhamnogalacturonyl hydrolase [Paenibacillus sophorae]